MDSTGIGVTQGGLLLSGGTASGTVINSGGEEVVYAGGTDVAGTVRSGGTLFISTGGKGGDTELISGGGEIVLSGGTAISGTLLGNEASDTTFGFAAVLSGGRMSGTVISSGGIVFVSGGGVTVANMPTPTVPAEALAAWFFPAPTAGNCERHHRQRHRAGSGILGGTDFGATAIAGGVVDVFSGGVGSGEVVESGGILHVGLIKSGIVSSAGGVAVNAVVQSGGTEQAIFGGVDFEHDCVERRCASGALRRRR